MAPHIALYDLDNTLYPYSSGLMQAIDSRIAAFVEARLHISAEEAAALRCSYFEQYGTTLRGLQHHHSSIDAEDYLTYVHDIAIDAFVVSDARLDAALSDLSLQKVIFTNSPIEYARRVLDQMGITHHFSHIFDIRAFGFLGKPHLDAYHTALRELGVQGSQCVLIEDTVANLAPAKELGMTTVLIPPSPDIRTVHADHIVEDVIEATELVQRLGQASSSIYITKPPVTSNISPLT